MTQIDVYIINRVVMEFQIYICPILRVFWSILVKCCVVFIRQRAPVKLKCFFQRRLFSTNIDCFVRDFSCLHLTFVAFCLLSVIHKQEPKHCNCSVDQSALVTRFWTDFTSSVWNFCCRRFSV